MFLRVVNVQKGRRVRKEKAAMMNVLVADDSRFMRRVIVHTIESAGITSISQASNGKEAYELFQSEEFDLVLADLRMAQHDGLSLISAIRAENAVVPIWVISASKELCGHALQAGANDFILKPFDMFVLSEKIKNMLAKHDRLSAQQSEKSNRRHNSVPKLTSRKRPEQAV
jgi:two-component system chemotaxis response regulator CheY